MGLKVVGDSPPLDVEGTAGRPVGIDDITFQHDGVVARPGDGERSRESCDAASGDDKPHTPKLSARRRSRQAGVVQQPTPQATEACKRDQTRVTPGSLRNALTEDLSV